MTTLTYQKTMYLTGLLIVAAIVTVPETVLELLLELSHLLIELTHYMFEILESTLDHIVEHIFETDTKETQIIVFYIITSMGLAGLYGLWRMLPRYILGKMKKMQAGLLFSIDQLLAFWAGSAANKFKIIAWFHGALTLVVLFTG